MTSLKPAKSGKWQANPKPRHRWAIKATAKMATAGSVNLCGQALWEISLKLIVGRTVPMEEWARVHLRFPSLRGFIGMNGLGPRLIVTFIRIFIPTSGMGGTILETVRWGIWVVMSWTAFIGRSRSTIPPASRLRKSAAVATNVIPSAAASDLTFLVA